MAVTSARSKGIRTTLSTGVGIGLAGMGIVFVIRSVVVDWTELRGVLSGAHWYWLAPAFGCAAATMVLLALGWRRALALVGQHARRTDAMRWYFVGQLAKYVPGGIWAVVGSSELAAGAGTSRSRAYGSMLFALGAAYLAGILTLAALLPLEIGFLDEVPAAAPIFLLIPLGVGAVHPVILHALLSRVQRWSPYPVHLDVPRWRASLGLVACHVPAWIVLGLGSWCVVRSLDPSAPVVNIMAASILAWIVGFLVVPAPGGLGVREAVFTVAATSLTSGVAAASAILARVLFVVVDLSSAAAMLLLRGRSDD